VTLDVKRATFHFILIGSSMIFTIIFGFPPSMYLPYRHVPKEFKSNAFWYEIFEDYQYDTSKSKDIIIRNSYIHSPTIVSLWFVC